VYAPEDSVTRQRNVETTLTSAVDDVGIQANSNRVDTEVRWISETAHATWRSICVTPPNATNDE